MVYTWFTRFKNGREDLNDDLRPGRPGNRAKLVEIVRDSSNLSPCDYFLFPKLKTKIKGAFYDDIPAIQAAVTEVLKNIPINDIKKSMHALVDRSKHCIKSNGTYFE